MEYGSYVPVSKSMAIRAILLDITANSHQQVPSITDTVSTIVDLPDDVKAAVQLSRDIKAGRNVVSVGESGTLYRFLIYWARKNNKIIEFTTRGTLRDREITVPDNLLDLTYPELLALDDGTSQWASAAMIAGVPFSVDEIPWSPFLTITFNSITKYFQALQKDEGFYSMLSPDQTFVRQFGTYLDFLTNKPVDFKPVSSEDFCFAVVMGLDVEELIKQFPQVVRHESNRYEAMVALANAGELPEILRNSKDHRVVMATAMKFGLGPGVFTYADCVSKSCPRFWDFMFDLRKNKIL